MVQHSLILSAIALLGMSHMMLGDVEAAPSVEAARRLFGRVYNSHRLYSSNVIFEENTDANSTSTGNDTCPIEIGNNTLDAVSDQPYSAIHLLTFFFYLVQSFSRYFLW
jgi:hypothetical protein